MTGRTGVGRSRIESHQSTAIPTIGFGTYQTKGYECFNAVQQALDAGYRHVDTAMAYENEGAVGRAIETAAVDRDEVFLTTKIKGYPEFVEHDRLLAAADGCLKRLGTEYIDLLLVHWWNPSADMAATFDAMNKLVDDGRVENIGVSNFSVQQLQRAMELSDAPIVTNQVEYHPYWQTPDLLRFCQANDITLTAYSPLAEGLLVEDDRLAVIGERYGKSAAQVAIRWLVQQDNVVTIPKSVTPSHIRSNMAVFDFSLTDREMARIADLEAPWWYRTNREGGGVHRLRGIVGKAVPDSLYERVP